MWLQNDRIIMDVPGATTEVATLKRALSEAENNTTRKRAIDEIDTNGAPGKWCVTTIY